ncbi:MAG: DUF309 domain-containing protein [Planctomycetes bacterium]|nr:DUF309 domain-containing protein [Planctomycetota bacterium]
MATLRDPENERALLTAFVAPRYTDIPFPPYRFVPGQNPHPTADPRGHSYHAPGTKVDKITLVSPVEWARSAEYRLGCDLYNHAYWWEAHEAWEDLWQLTDKSGVQGRFLQGLIQTSACHLKRFMGRMNGVKRLQRTSVGYLSSVLDETDGGSYMGLDLAAFVRSFEAYYHTLGTRMETRIDHDPRAYPYLRLNVGERRKTIS